MRPSRRQIQPFVRRWQAGRTNATALAVALSVGAFAAQFIVESLFAGQPAQRDILRTWLQLDDSVVQTGQWWKFLSFGLLHGGVVPLLANIVLLFLAGRELEPIVGRRHFAAIYLIGNLLGGITHWSFMRWQPLMGVSAGVAAVIVAYTTILPELEVTCHLLFVLPVHIRAKHLAWALFAVCGICCATQTATPIGPAGMIAGAIFGWAYVKQLGYGNPLAIQRYIFDRRQRAARLARMSPEQFVAAEIDPILEKIAQRGVKSLTRSERKILEQGRGKLSTPEKRK
jgi:membrane associated rhomboid family serine protease